MSNLVDLYKQAQIQKMKNEEQRKIEELEQHKKMLTELATKVAKGLKYNYNEVKLSALIKGMVATVKDLGFKYFTDWVIIMVKLDNEAPIQALQNEIEKYNIKIEV